MSKSVKLEKVLDGLKHHKGGTFDPCYCHGCPYDTNTDGCSQKLARDAVRIINKLTRKKKPTPIRRYFYYGDDGNHFLISYLCGNCEKELVYCVDYLIAEGKNIKMEPEYEKDKFCRLCGQPVTWNGVAETEDEWKKWKELEEAKNGEEPD